MKVLPRTPALGSTLAALLIAAGPAHATLGGELSSVEADRAHLQAVHRIGTPAAATSGAAAASEPYTVHELVMQNGVLVREYASTLASGANTVFAVTWTGPRHPDLTQLLGSYFPRYAASARKAAAHGRQPIRLADADLVISTTGHPRAFHGVVFLPQQLPAGVEPGALQ